MRILIRFEDGARFPHGLVVEIIESIAQRLFAVERAAIERAADEIPSLPSIVVDAARQRVERYRGSVLQVEAARPGSLELVVIGTALGYWILDKALGETIKEAWKETELHERLRQFFLSGKRERTDAVVEAVSQPFRHSYRRESIGREVHVKHEVSDDGSHLTIHVVEERRIEITTYEELERGERKRS